MSIPVPPQTDPRWRSILMGQKEPTLTALASRLMVHRLRQSVRSQPTAIGPAVQELHTYFSTSPFAQRDIQSVLGA